MSIITKIKTSGKKDDRQNIIYLIFLGTVFFGTVAFLVVSDLRINKKRSEMLDEIESLQAELKNLEDKNQQLQAGIVQTEADVYWEEKAREQGYKKPGEEQVVVLPAEELSQTSTEKQKSLWETIIGKLGL